MASNSQLVYMHNYNGVIKYKLIQPEKHTALT